MNTRSPLKPPTKPVYLKTTGTSTPLGLTTEQTASAVRAGLSAYEESSIYNKRFNPMTMALLPEDALPPLNAEISDEMPGLTSRQVRMIRLAHLALDDLSSKLKTIETLPLFLAGPEKLPGQQEVCYPELIDHISKQSGIVFHEKHSVIFPNGRAGGLWALHYAMAYVQAGYSQYAIVGGVDTYLDLYLLGSLDMEDRILAEGVMDGFAPGEGAGFFIISSQSEPFEQTSQNITLYPPGLAKEEGHRYSQEPYRGDGLAEAFSLALDHASNIPPMQTVLTSLNGENFGAKELGVAATRNSERLIPEYIISHSADCFGDIGAAFFPVSVALTATGFLNDYIKGPVLDYASSETDFRAAVCITKN